MNTNLPPLPAGAVLDAAPDTVAAPRQQYQNDLPPLPAGAVLDPLPGSSRETWGSYAKGMARSVGQGAAFGFSDEIEAAIASAFGSETYGEAQDRVRSELADFKRRNPGTALTAEVIGSIAVPGRAAIAAGSKLAGAGAGMVRRSLASSGVGIVEGGISGGGRVDATEIIDADRIPGAGTGMVVGGVAGGAAPMVAQTARQVGETIGSFVPMIDKAVARRAASRTTADAITADAKAGFNGFDNEISRLRKLPEAEHFQASLSTSAGKNVRELADETADRGGRAGDVFDTYRSSVNATRRGAGAQYDNLYTDAPVSSQTLSDLIAARPTLTKLHDAAVTWARDSGEGVVDGGFSPRVLHRLDETLRLAVDKGEAPRALLQTFRSEADAALPRLKDIRSEYAKSARLLDAVPDTGDGIASAADSALSIGVSVARGRITDAVIKVARVLKSDADTAKKLAQILVQRFGYHGSKGNGEFNKALDAISKMAPGRRDAYIRAAIQGAGAEAAGKTGELHKESSRW